MSDSEDWSSRLNATPRRPTDSVHFNSSDTVWPDGSASIEQPEYGPEEVHSVLTPAGEIESAGRFYRGLGSRWTKVVLFGTIGFILIVGVLDEVF